MPFAGHLDRLPGLELRAYYEALRGQQESVRAQWDPTWRQITDFVRPLRAQFTWAEANDGARRDQRIINNHATVCVRVLASGMINGMTSPTRAWFSLYNDVSHDSNGDPIDPDAAAWHEKVTEMVRSVMVSSNFYQSLMECYSQESTIGTTCMMINEDPRSVIRCKVYPIGSYTIALDDTLRVDLVIRVFPMTARQVIARFGAANVSPTIRTMVESNAGGIKETTYPVVHVLHRGAYDNPDATQGRWPWVSIWYEQGAISDGGNPVEPTGILEKTGYFEQPFCCGRWETEGENPYGFSPLWDCLGDVMSLQVWESMTSEGVERVVKPQLIVSSQVNDALKAASNPGDIAVANMTDVSKAAAPLYSVTYQIEPARQMIQSICQRIDAALFRDVFQTFIGTENHEMTAEEVRARSAEKLQVLGPVIERNIEEILEPAVIRIVSIMHRRGMLPPMPPSMRNRMKDGQPLQIKMRFESILAQAQRMQTVNNINALVQFIGQESPIMQGLADNIDPDALLRMFARACGVPLSCFQPADAVAAIRQQRAQQQAQAQFADNAQKLAPAAQAAANIPPDQAGALMQSIMPPGGVS